MVRQLPSRTMPSPAAAAGASPSRRSGGSARRCRAGSRPPPAGRRPCAGSPAATAQSSRQARSTWWARQADLGSANRATIWRASTPEPRGPAKTRRTAFTAPRSTSDVFWQAPVGSGVSGSVAATDQASPSPRAGIRAAVSRCAREPSGRAAGIIVGGDLVPGRRGRWWPEESADGVAVAAAVGSDCGRRRRLRVLALLRSGRGVGLVGAGTAAGHEDGGEQRRKQDPRHT